jgi:hypothetical protein
MNEEQMQKVIDGVSKFAQRFLGPVSELGLEAFEQDGDLWRVTFGYRPGWANPESNDKGLFRDLRVPRREYRVFIVKADGTVVAMKRPESEAAA